MISAAEPNPDTQYRPAIRMRIFVKKLEIFVRDRGEVSDRDFRIHLHQAFEHARAMFMGGGSRLFVAIGKECEVTGGTVRDWMTGKALLQDESRLLVLRRLHHYLSVRYA